MQTNRSPFEAELLAGATALRGWHRQHDRYVLIGLAVSLIPLPPASVVALLMARINSRFIREGKLPEHEAKIIRVSVILACIGLAVFCALAFFIYSSRTDALVWVSHALERFSVLNWLFGTVQSSDTISI